MCPSNRLKPQENLMEICEVSEVENICQDLSVLAALSFPLLDVSMILAIRVSEKQS